MELFTVDGVDISLEALSIARTDGVQRLRVCNCEWKAEFEIVPRSHGELGYSVEVTPLVCTGNQRKFARDLARIEPVFARLVPNPEACLVISHPLELRALRESA